MMIKERAMGALVGLACGDAVGTTLEFELRGTFEPLTDSDDIHRLAEALFEQGA